MSWLTDVRTDGITTPVEAYLKSRPMPCREGQVNPRPVPGGPFNPPPLADKF